MNITDHRIPATGHHARRGFLAALLAFGAWLAATATAAAAGPRVIAITANDNMKFSVTRIEAAPGEQLKIVLENVGKLPKQAMGHNLVLLKKDANAQAYANAALRAAAADYIPAELADQVVAHTKMLGPKQKDEIVITVPAEPGDYPYLCTFPAHFVAGMKGVLVVK